MENNKQDSQNGRKEKYKRYMENYLMVNSDRYNGLQIRPIKI